MQSQIHQGQHLASMSRTMPVAAPVPRQLLIHRTLGPSSHMQREERLRLSRVCRVGRGRQRLVLLGRRGREGGMLTAVVFSAMAIDLIARSGM